MKTLRVIGIVLVVLKLCGLIAWSWLLVTAPFWGPYAAGASLVLLALLASAMVVAVIAMVKHPPWWRRIWAQIRTGL